MKLVSSCFVATALLGVTSFACASEIKTQNVFVIGNYQDDIRKDVIAHCQALDKPMSISRCLVLAGDNMQKSSKYFATNPGSNIAALCKTQTEKQPNHWFYFLDCATRQIDIKESHPVPQLSHLAFGMNEYRSQWLVSCKKNSSKTISSCIEEKEKAFHAFWQHYLSLRQNPAKSEAFILCLTKEAIDTADFESINSCTTNKR